MIEKVSWEAIQRGAESNNSSVLNAYKGFQSEWRILNAEGRS